jgi:hypothetical protein
MTKYENRRTLARTHKIQIQDILFVSQLQTMISSHTPRIISTLICEYAAVGASPPTLQLLESNNKQRTQQPTPTHTLTHTHTHPTAGPQHYTPDENSPKRICSLGWDAPADKSPKRICSCGGCSVVAGQLLQLFKVNAFNYFEIWLTHTKQSA